MKFAASCSIHQDKLMQPCTRWAPISLQKRTNAGYGLKIIGYWGDLAARASVMIFWIFALSILIAPRVACAATWQATVGSQSTDKGIQALAFLPNELWIHAGDSKIPTPSSSGLIAQVPPEGVVQGRRPVLPASMAQPA